MTERGRAALDRSPRHLSIGPSRLVQDGQRLTIDVEEWTVPWPRRLRGRVVIDLDPFFTRSFALDADGRHRWQPVAPCATCTVAFDKPHLAWQGTAYVDTNFGSEPLEAGFRRWTWSREERAASTAVLYEVERRDGSRRTFALDCRRDGSMAAFDAPPVQPLAATAWRVSRQTRASGDRPARITRTLEDTPFYSRSMLALGRGAGESRAIHESVDLDRFASRWVQILLPFKMPRRASRR